MNVKKQHDECCFFHLLLTHGSRELFTLRLVLGTTKNNQTTINVTPDTEKMLLPAASSS